LRHISTAKKCKRRQLISCVHLANEQIWVATVVVVVVVVVVAVVVKTLESE
jgi:hypothetical protein